MVSTFHGIETSKRGMLTQMTALNTTGNNISNANTTGYSRQVVKITATEPMDPYAFLRSTASGQLGTGSEAYAINRIRDSFLDAQFRSENAGLGTWKTHYDTLDKIETIMNEPSAAGIQTVLDRFWNAWSDFSNNPNDITNRNIVAEATLALTGALNTTGTKLDTLENDINNNIALKSTEINGYLQQIADLNQSIVKLEGFGDKANDLRDKRDEYVDQLSRLGNVAIIEQGNGSYDVTFGGQAAVTGGTVTATSAVTLQAAYQGGTLTGGEIHGMYKSIASVQEYRSDMDNIANMMANGQVTVTLPGGSVLPEGTVLNNVTYSDANNNRTLSTDLTVTVAGMNGLQQLGYNLSGVAGQPLFTANDGGAAITARNITLNPNVKANPGLLPSSMRLKGASVVQGNNDLALLMGKLKSTPFMNGTSTATIHGFFTSTLGKLGVQSQNAERQVENAQTLKDQVQSNRQSVSGVSLDEEMSNLIKFQKAYSAAARFMTTYDEMLNKLINGTAV